MCGAIFGESKRSKMLNPSCFKENLGLNQTGGIDAPDFKMAHLRDKTH